MGGRQAGLQSVAQAVSVAVAGLHQGCQVQLVVLAVLVLAGEPDRHHHRPALELAALAGLEAAEAADARLAVQAALAARLAF